MPALQTKSTEALRLEALIPGQFTSHTAAHSCTQAGCTKEQPPLERCSFNK